MPSFVDFYKDSSIPGHLLLLPSLSVGQWGKHMVAPIRTGDPLKFGSELVKRICYFVMCCLAILASIPLVPVGLCIKGIACGCSRLFSRKGGSGTPPSTPAQPQPVNESNISKENPISTSTSKLNSPRVPPLPLKEPKPQTLPVNPSLEGKILGEVEDRGDCLYLSLANLVLQQPEHINFNELLSSIQGIEQEQKMPFLVSLIREKVAQWMKENVENEEFVPFLYTSISNFIEREIKKNTILQNDTNSVLKANEKEKKRHRKNSDEHRFYEDENKKKIEEKAELNIQIRKLQIQLEEANHYIGTALLPSKEMKSAASQYIENVKLFGFWADQAEIFAFSHYFNVRVNVKTKESPRSEPQSYNEGGAICFNLSFSNVKKHYEYYS